MQWLLTEKPSINTVRDRIKSILDSVMTSNIGQLMDITNQVFSCNP